MNSVMGVSSNLLALEKTLDNVMLLVYGDYGIERQCLEWVSSNHNSGDEKT
jgi:hypothetical protein